MNYPNKTYQFYLYAAMTALRYSSSGLNYPKKMPPKQTKPKTELRRSMD
jgi:hypothetical protein